MERMSWSLRSVWSSSSVGFAGGEEAKAEYVWKRLSVCAGGFVSGGGWEGRFLPSYVPVTLGNGPAAGAGPSCLRWGRPWVRERESVWASEGGREGGREGVSE